MPGERCAYVIGDRACKGRRAADGEFCWRHRGGVVNAIPRVVRGCGCTRAGEWKFCPFCAQAIPTKQTIVKHARAALLAENEALKAELAQLKKDTAWLSTPKA